MSTNQYIYRVKHNYQKPKGFFLLFFRHIRLVKTKLLHFSLTRKKIKSKKLVEESTERENNIEVWHGTECKSCVALSSINNEEMTCLQHHYKHCACYSILNRVVANLETQDNKVPKKESNFLNHAQVKQLCQTASTKLKCKESSNLFERAAELSDQLLGPVETAAFDCDRYEEYMTLLLDIAKIFLKRDAKTLIKDIKNYLKPFSRNQTIDESIGEGGNVVDSRTDTLQAVKKWNETYLDLRHSSGDEEFGKNLKEIVAPNRGGKCFFFPEKYDFFCHGQKASPSE